MNLLAETVIEYGIDPTKKITEESSVPLIEILKEPFRDEVLRKISESTPAHPAHSIAAESATTITPDPSKLPSRS